nr:50S ribosomal protein L2 [Candidatus Njordarchaeota archaeon]
MGKKILVQRKGRGTSTFRAPTHRSIGEARYPPLPEDEGSYVKGYVKEILHDPGRGTPVALIRFRDGSQALLPACEGLRLNQVVVIGGSSVPQANRSEGNILPLSAVPEGTPVFNVEGEPGDGGKYVRASGTYGTVITQTATGTLVQLPSGAMKAFNPSCRATVGIVSGGGRTEKPFVKAGKKYHFIHSRALKWPIVRGVAMNAVSHPHGGGQHQHEGAPTTVSRNAPPGAKVGLIAARQTGRGRRSRSKETV